MEFSYPELLCLTTDNSEYSHSEQVEILVSNGAKFIQFRTKKLKGQDLLDQVNLAKSYTDGVDVVLIINDYVDVAHTINISGVHIGQNDSTIEYARGKLGEKAVIGSTVHSLSDAEKVKNKGLCSYVGLGPYRRTKTKPKLENFLDAPRIVEIVNCLSPIPVFLIGGICLDDCKLISKFDLYGLAVCGGLSSHISYGCYVKNFLDEIEKIKSVF